MLKILVAAIAALTWANAAQAAEVADLVGNAAYDMRGERIGVVEDLVLDVRAGRVLYIIVEGPERFRIYPVRALKEANRLDTAQAGEIASLQGADDPRFRRAGRLLGEHVQPPGGEPFGVIADIEFDPGSGEVQRVIALTDDGTIGLPATVLAHGRFPPLTEWQVEHPSAVVGNKGFLRRPPSDERRALHNHWQDHR
jgi:sporulation protein YlmC with PRC-barrel domain